ncbi:response regulator transcription factor [Methylomonas sp. LL1]|uniref:response regulator n=1 Tax=Methylomonas sp. LL1 TaxID=2785785 RepID=UPI0018C3AA26|nr:response regulator transcription factor [Methylomonas sp. LL1]QPK64253.1 response regulator transcription factor [Methylomonas sp. LL1]
MIRVLLADDHPIVRKGLKNLITSVPDMTVVGEATCGYEVLDYLRNQAVELLLLDMSMPEPSGVDLIVRIRSHGFSLPILILSMHQDVAMVARAIKAGANGYIGKESAAEELLLAIRKTADGGRFINAQMAEQLIFAPTDIEENAQHKHLSNREFEIFRLLTDGQGVNQIAERLKISNKTVSTHKIHLMEKMQVSSTAELVKYALQHRLFE